MSVNNITITGNVIEDENLGLTSLATDTDDAANPDDNVVLLTFQNNISTSLGDRLTALGIYPAETTNPGTTQAAIGISEDTNIVSTADTNLIFSDINGAALVGVDSGFKAIDGKEIFLYSDSSNPDIVLGREGSSGGADPNGTVAFALLLQPTASGATIWVVQYEALTNPQNGGEDVNTLTLKDLVYVTGSTTTSSSFLIGTKKPGQNYWLPFTSSSGTSTVLVTGLDASAASPDTVNTSSVGDGSNSQAITPGGALRFDFVTTTGYSTTTNTKDKTFLTDSSLSISTFIEGTGASFDISQVTPTGKTINVKIIAQNESAGTFGSGLGSYTDTAANTVPLTEIKVWTGGINGTLIADSARAPSLNHGITFGGTAGAPDGTVNNLAVNETIQILTGSTLFDQFVVENNNPPKGAGFDILNVTQTQSSTSTDHTEVGSHIIFEDSVPTASINVVAKTVYEDGLVALDDPTSATTANGSVTTLFNPGVDTPLTYKLSSDYSSLTSQNLVSGGTPLAYVVSSDGTTLTATKGSGGPTVFTLTLDTSGTWNFTLSASVDHAPGADDSKQTTIDFGGLVLATDADGSQATAALAALAVTVVDDVPENFTPVPIASADNIQDAAGSTATKNLTGGATDPYPTLNIDNHAGADGFGALTFTGTNGSQLTGQLDSGATGTPLTTADGSAIYLFGFGTGTLTATTDSTGVNAADNVFTITTDPANNQYTFDMLQAIGNGSRTLFSDFADVPAGDYAWFSLPFNPTTKQPVTPGKSVVFTGKTAGTDTVNPSSIGTGTDAQSVKDGNAIRIDFVNDVHSINTTNDLKSLGTLGYAGHYEVNDSGFTLAQVNGSGGPNAAVDIRLDAYDIAQGPLAVGGPFPTDSGQDAITEVKLVTFDSSGNETVLGDFKEDSLGGGAVTKSITAAGKTEAVTVNFGPTGDGSGADVEGLKYIPGVYILATTADGFDRLVATNVDTTYNNANHSFDVGAVSAGTFVAGTDVNMAFNLALQDYDAFSSGANLQSGNLIEASTGTLNIKLTAPTV